MLPRRRAHMIFVPSGDQRGLTNSPAASVSCITPLPSRFITKSWKPIIHASRKHPRACVVRPRRPTVQCVLAGNVVIVRRVCIHNKNLRLRVTDASVQNRQSMPARTTRKCSRHHSSGALTPSRQCGPSPGPSSCRSVRRSLCCRSALATIRRGRTGKFRCVKQNARLSAPRRMMFSALPLVSWRTFVSVGVHAAKSGTRRPDRQRMAIFFRPATTPGESLVSSRPT